MCEDLDRVLDDAEGDDEPTPAGGWPKRRPDPGDLRAVRRWLEQAMGLPAGWRVDRVERRGRYADDPLTIFVKRPNASEIEIDFQQVRSLTKPSELRMTVADATDGAANMKYPKPAEASDFHMVACALSVSEGRSTMRDETSDWLDGYVGIPPAIEGLSFRSDRREAALAALQGRGEFGVVRARSYVAGMLDPLDLWAVIIDEATDELWIRVREFATFVRHCVGSRIAQHTLDARVGMIGGDRRTVEVDERRSGPDRVHRTLRLYRFPSSQAFPSVIRIQTPPAATRALLRRGQLGSLGSLPGLEDENGGA